MGWVDFTPSVSKPAKTGEDHAPLNCLVKPLKETCAVTFLATAVLLVLVLSSMAKWFGLELKGSPALL
jgi:hypothetical protein